MRRRNSTYLKHKKLRRDTERLDFLQNKRRVKVEAEFPLFIGHRASLKLKDSLLRTKDGETINKYVEDLSSNTLLSERRDRKNIEIITENEYDLRRFREDYRSSGSLNLFLLSYLPDFFEKNIPPEHWKFFKLHHRYKRGWGGALMIKKVYSLKIPTGVLAIKLKREYRSFFRIPDPLVEQEANYLETRIYYTHLDQYAKALKGIAYRGYGDPAHRDAFLGKIHSYNQHRVYSRSRFKSATIKTINESLHMSIQHVKSTLAFEVKKGNVVFKQKEHYKSAGIPESHDGFNGECALDSDNLKKWAHSVIDSWIDGDSIREDAVVADDEADD